MHTYQYQPGDTPLEGYTIKSAAGHGGFGEVYYAVSDAGREVALKAVQGFEQIELRGISQCMNLKNPHLVTIFDVRHNEQGQPFVLMEYVSGPSLRDLIDETPDGLSPQKAAFFLREIAKGLSYLHDCGIVHRDLKPANIFFEDGYVKIGDYGLSKAMNADHHQSQTVTVGTVHYMAPEIGAGKYDRSIDIYAMGVMLYEMLTGKVPFRGDSPSEILMKHLSSDPDLDPIEEPFREAIRRAMAKDPAQRYQNVSEMVDTVFGAERIKQSMAGYSGADLSMAAAYVGAKMHYGGSATVSESDSDSSDVAQRMDQALGTASRHLDGAARRLDEKISGRPAGVRPGRSGVAKASHDPMPVGQRRRLGLVAALMVSAGTGMLAESHWGGILSYSAFMFTAILGAIVGMEITNSKLIPSIEKESRFLKRLTLGGMAGGLAWLFSVPVWFASWNDFSPMTYLPLVVTFALMDWDARMKPGRLNRLSFGSAVMAGVIAWFTTLFLDDAHKLVAIALPAGVMLISQIISPFDPTTTEDWAVDETIPPYDKTRSHAQKAKDHAHAPHQPLKNTERVNAYSTVITDNDSHRSRLLAVLMACLPFVTGIPLFGIHRFYAGKTGTGILWLLTGGICGVGQIVDIILIACGSFYDSEGRPIRDWHLGSDRRHRHAVAAASHPHVNRVPGPGLFDTMLSMVASLLIFAGIAVAALLVVRLPEMIAADVFGIGLNSEFDRLFGYEQWPRLLHTIGGFVAFIAIVVGASMLMVARRALGVMHVMRVVFGSVLVGVASIIGVEKLYQTHDVVNDIWLPMADQLHAQRLGPAIDVMLRQLDLPAVILSFIFLLIGMLMLVWPPMPHELEAARSGEGV